MKRCAEERREDGNIKGPKENEPKKQKMDDPVESENTGGASSSKEYRNPEDSDDQHAESSKNKIVPNVKGPSRK